MNENSTAPRPSAPLAIVVPVYNRAGIVGRTLESIQSQTLRPLHIVLVDNGSTDGTADVLRQWADDVSDDDFFVDIIECAVPGAAAARNAGLERVGSEWVMFFDSDDTMPAGHAAGIIAAAGSTGADMVGFDVTECTGKKRRTLRFCPHAGREQHDNLFGGMSTQRWAARTALVRLAGGWNDGVTYWDDIELGARMLAQKPAIARTRALGVSVYAGGDGITSAAVGRPGQCLPALQSIERTLSPVVGAAKARHMCMVKLAIECGLADRDGGRIGRKLLKAHRPDRRAYAAYLYTRAGLRGAARLFV